MLLFLFVAFLWMFPGGFHQEVSLGPLDGLELSATDFDRVQVGQLAPDFRLRDEQGDIHQLSQYRGSKNVILVVYRGHW